jgi:hypothetical protein
MDSATRSSGFQRLTASSSSIKGKIAIAIALFLGAVGAVTAADVPSLTGTIRTIEDGEPVGHAVLIISYVGKTLLSEIPMYEGATHHSGRRCASRLVIESNQNGLFVSPSFKLHAHVGSPEFHVVMYKEGYRSKVTGEWVAPTTTTLAFGMWSDGSALKYNALNGEELHLDEIEDKASYVDIYLSEHGYLADWLAYGGLARKCEQERNQRRRGEMLKALFAKWIATAPSHPKPALEKATCNELELAQKEFGKLLDFAHEAKLKRLCPQSSME